MPARRVHGGPDPEDGAADPEQLEDRKPGRDCTISSGKGVRAVRKVQRIVMGGGVAKKIASSSAGARAPEAAARRVGAAVQNRPARRANPGGKHDAGR